VAETNALTEGKDVPGPMLYDAARVCALAAASVKDDAKLSESNTPAAPWPCCARLRRPAA
jgi:hypothetical protein